MSIRNVSTDIIINEIVTYLSKDDIIHLCQTNKEYKDVCSKSSVWKFLSFRDFKDLDEQDKPSNVSWKNFYWYWVDISSLENPSDDLVNKIIMILNDRAKNKQHQRKKGYQFNHMNQYYDEKEPIIYELSSIEEFLLNNYTAVQLRQLISQIPDGRLMFTNNPDRFLPLGEIIDDLIELLTIPNDAFTDKWIVVSEL
jgi:hypothetical protein